MIIINFAVADRLEAPAVELRAGRRHDEKCLSALILDFPEFSQNSFRFQGKCSDECPWICNYLAFGTIFREKYSRTY